jgi:GxxExxY protein
MREEDLNSVTERVIGCAYRVHNVLGPGFLEKVYENALVHELRKAGVHVAQQVGFEVMYDGICVGQFVSDLIAGECVLLELKAARGIDDSNVAQCLNFLTVTGLPIGLVINFGRSVNIKRLRPPRDE